MADCYRRRKMQAADSTWQVAARLRVPQQWAGKLAD
jgi:hypothetical protein